MATDLSALPLSALVENMQIADLAQDLGPYLVAICLAGLIALA